MAGENLGWRLETVVYIELLRRKGLLLASEKTNCNKLLLITDHDEQRITQNEKQIDVVTAYSCLVDKKLGFGI